MLCGFFKSYGTTFCIPLLKDYNSSFKLGFFLVGGLAIESQQPNYTQQEVFRGWKSIAHYLGIGVRTAQRYERGMGLPIRRPCGHPAGSVVAVKADLDSWVQSSPIGREPLDASQRARREQLSAELAKRLQERAHLHDEMMALRKELKANIRAVRESVAKVRQQLNETQKRQDSISSVIKRYSKVLQMLPVEEKRRKPN